MTERNPYLGLEDDADALRASRLAGSLSTAVTSNPDQVSAQRRTATYLGYPLAAVEALPKETGLQAAVKRVTDATANSPALQNKYLDPEFAKLAHDDAGKLSEIEQAVRKYGELKAWKGPEPTTGSVLRGLAESLPQGFRAAREGLRQQMGDLFDALGILPRTEQEKAEQLRRTARAQGASDFTTPEFESSTAKGIYGGLASTLRQAPGIALSVVTGNPTPVLASIGVQTQAEAYGKYRARGATPGQAFVGGTAEGAVEVGTELLPMGFLVNKLGKVGMTEFFTGMLARELPSEQVATLLQDAIDTAIANPDKTWAQYLNERPEAAYQTLVATITQSAVMGGVSAAARRALRDTNQINDAETDAQRIGALFAMAGESKLRERDPQAFAELVQGVADQTEGAPKSVFIDAATLAETLQQSGLNEAQLEEVLPGVAAQLPEAMAAGGTVELPIGDLVARVTGTPLEQALLPNLRTTPDALSQAEAQEAAGQAETYLQQQAERVIAEATDADAMRASAEVVKANVLDQLNATKRFRPDVNEAYATLARAFYTTMAGRTGVTPEEMFARYPLRIVSEQADGGVLDKALGQSQPDLFPGEFATKRTTVPTQRVISSKGDTAKGVNVNSAGQKITATKQGLTNFWSWFGASEVTDDAGKPLVLYHSTNADTNVLRGGQKTTNNYGLLGDVEVTRSGVFLTPDREFSQEYLREGAGQNVMPVYAKIENALDLRSGLSERDEAALEAAGVNVRYVINAQNTWELFDNADDGTNDFVEGLRRAGYDGAIFRESSPSGETAGGTTYVAFNPEQIKSATGNDGTFDANDPSILSQGDQAPRATFSPSRMEIALLKDADLSSFLHEMGHFFLEVQADLASQPGAPQQIVDDFNTVLKWFGIKGDEKAGGADSGMPLGQGATQEFDDALDNLLGNDLEDDQVFSRPLPAADADGLDYVGKFGNMHVSVRGEGVREAGPHEFFFHGNDGTPLGFARLTKNAKQASINMIAFTEDARGMGYGKAFYKYLLDDLGVEVKSDKEITEGTAALYRSLAAEYGSRVDPDGRVVLTPSALAQNGPTTDAPAPTVKRTPAETWRAMTLDQKRPYHERWAESWEQYLFEGKAPSVEMRGVFQRFREFMISAYKSLKNFLRMRSGTVGGQAGAFEQPAYHGTPYRGIEKFDTSKIGTGEGAQAYGYGLYFAGRKEVADFYRRKLAGEGSRVFTKDGKTIESAADLAEAYFQPGRIVRGYSGADKVLEFRREGFNWSVKVVGVSPSGQPMASERPRWHSTQPDAPTLKDVLEEDGWKASPAGQLYEVDIPEDSEMLLWDKPLSEQSAKVREALERKAEDFFVEQADKAGMDLDAYERMLIDTRAKYPPQTRNGIDGETYYRELTAYFSDQKAASDYLASAGIKGIKYLDGTSRAAGDGSYNYVIFSGDDVAIRDTFYQGRTPGNPLGLSDEVRGVFDRLIATDEQIAEAQSLANFEAVFKSAEQAGMTPEEWAAYQAQNAAATAEATETLQKKSLADMKWVAAARGKALRKAQAEVKDKRDAMRAEVTAEVEALPIEQARAYIKGLRVSTPEQRDALKDWGDRRDAAMERAREEVKAALLASPEAADLKGIKKGQYLAKNKKLLDNQAEAKVIEWEAANPRPTPVLPEPQMDSIAEQFGFTSGDELAKALVEQPPAAQFIEALTEQRLLETYGEVVTADGMARAANEAVHNEARRRFVATELAAMQRAMSATAPTGKTDKKGRPLGVNVIVQAAKAFAETVVNRRKILDLKPAQHAAAATRAAAKAAKLTAEGKTAEAIGAKRDQLLSEYTARYSEQARQEVLKGLEYLKKFDKASVREKLPADYVDQIDQMLERFEFKTSTTARELDRRASLAAWVASQQEMGLDPVVPQDLLDNARLTSYKQMTVEEFRGLVDGVKSIEHLARLKSKLLAAKDKREFDAIADEIAASIVEHGGTPRPVQLEPDGRIKKFFKGAWADHRKLNSLIRQMDGGKDNGPFYRALVRSMNDAGAREATMIEQATEALAKIYAPIEKLPGGFSGAKVYIDEIKNSLSRAGRLAVALNWGNPQNRQRVMDGDGWTEAQVNAILRTLSPVELKFVNDVWAHIDSYWPEIKAKQERVTGVVEEKVDAVPFEITLADGTTVQMRGGYYPIKYDADRSIKAEKQEALETAKEIMRGAVARPTTRRGHTKARVDEVKGRPVRKDLSVITQHVNQVVHDLAWHEWFIDANRLLNDKRIAGAIRQYHGNDAARVLKEAADAIAVGDAVHQGQIDRLLLAMRSNVSRSVMGASLTTAIMQPFGLTQSMARVGVVPVLKGAARWAGDAARMESTVGWINEKSEFMRLRGKTFNRELREISQRVQGKSKFMQVYDASLFMLMQKLQLVADVPTWVGAYEKALAGGVDESAAVALADEAVLSSQGGGTTKDLAAVQRNMPFLTQFYSYFNTTLNLVAEKTATTDFKDPKAAAGWMADMALLTVIPAILPALLTFLLKGGGDEDDDAEKWAKRILEWQAGYLFGMFVGLRELPTLWSPFDYAGPPAAKVLSDGKKVVQQAGQGEIDDPAVIASINLLGSVFGLPTVQVTRSYKGWKAWSEGDAPASSILFGPPPKEN